MISKRHKCIFVHIPRCAGSSIEAVIWGNERRERDLWMGFVDPYRNKYQTGGLQHLRATQIRQEVGSRRFSSYFKFSMVRNPFDRLVSQFAYMRRREDLRDFVGMREDASFAEYFDLIDRKSHVQWEPQCSFLYDDDGALLVDFVGRFENLERDAAGLLERLGIEAAAFPHRNTSERAPYRDYYTADIRARAEDMYRDDLDRLGYEF